jgi:hypothetical protein
LDLQNGFPAGDNTMTISSLSAPSYASLLTSQSSPVNSASALPTNSGSIGDQLLAALAQSQATSGASSDPLLQELVSLSPSALGQTTTTPQTYNAQGLLQQVQSSTLLNDPLFQLDATDTSGTNSNSLMQALMSLPQIPTTATNAVGSSNPAASSQTSATTAGSTDLNANWAQLLKQNPALASVLVESQMDQGILSMFGP